MVEGGRGVCWADQKEDIQKEVNHMFSDSVTLSPLTESNLHFDVRPSSVLRPTQLPSTVVEPEISSGLDETVVLQSAALDVTFDLNSVHLDSESQNTKVNLMFELYVNYKVCMIFFFF